MPVCKRKDEEGVSVSWIWECDFSPQLCLKPFLFFLNTPKVTSPCPRVDPGNTSTSGRVCAQQRRTPAIAGPCSRRGAFPESYMSSFLWSAALPQTEQHLLYAQLLAHEVTDRFSWRIFYGYAHFQRAAFHSVIVFFACAG